MIDKETFLVLNAMKNARLVFHPTNGYRAMGIMMPVDTSEVTALLQKGFIKSIRGMGGVYELTAVGLSYLKSFNPRADAETIGFCCQCHGAYTSHYRGIKDGRHWWTCDACLKGK